MKAMLLAAGMGTRMRPRTEIRYGTGDTFNLGEIVLRRIFARRHPSGPRVVREIEDQEQVAPEPIPIESAKTDDRRAARKLG